ncbi:MAG: hypothetical protein JNJ59_11020 [Deltaproteobacteria bacterium]|nr:hypothetical protein [Deltaproteobacteria bacterium]
MSTEAWRWGELFELDVPLDAEVTDLGEMVQIRFAEDPETPLLLATFTPATGAPLTPNAAPSVAEDAVRSALERFAASRGASPLMARGAELVHDDNGLHAGRLAFVTDLAWLALAVAWNQHLVVAFAGAPDESDAIFDRAESLLATLQPLDLVAPVDLAPEPPGTF